MDESKPPISPNECHLRSASEPTSADIDPAPLELGKSGRVVGAGPESRSGQTQLGRDDCSDKPSIAVYYRDGDEVRQGFLVALHAMGIAGFEQLPEPAKPSIRGAKP
jgi:hypothetical protein